MRSIFSENSILKISSLQDNADGDDDGFWTITLFHFKYNSKLIFFKCSYCGKCFNVCKIFMIASEIKLEMNLVLHPQKLIYPKLYNIYCAT